jgi:hypothetical protein
MPKAPKAVELVHRQAEEAVPAKLAEMATNFELFECSGFGFREGNS